MSLSKCTISNDSTHLVLSPLVDSASTIKRENVKQFTLSDAFFAQKSSVGKFCIGLCDWLNFFLQKFMSLLTIGWNAATLNSEIVIYTGQTGGVVQQAPSAPALPYTGTHQSHLFVLQQCEIQRMFGMKFYTTIHREGVPIYLKKKNQIRNLYFLLWFSE